MIAFLLRATRGYWLTPWRSPYLRWRLETYAGLPAEQITFPVFCGFCWRERRQLWRFLHWSERMRGRTAERS